jgi:hypothetical protein
MLVFPATLLTRSARWLGLGAILAALPLALSASMVTVNFTINVNGLDGQGQFVVDPTAASSDGGGNFAYSGHGLDSFQLTYNGNTYNMADDLDPATLPTVTLPGNLVNPAGLDYGFLALWVVSGSCTGPAPNFTCVGPGGVGDATLIGLGRNSVQAFLANGLTQVNVSNAGTSFVSYNLGTAPDLSVIRGTLTSETVAPEPAALPVMALGLAGLWFVRRRKATV